MPNNWSDAKRAHVEAAQRPRQLIFNDDTHELALESADTPEGFLGHRLTPLAGTQVGTIAWSVLCGQFDAPVYDSHVQPIYGDAHGRFVHYWHRATENVRALTREHRCPLHLVTDFAHAYGMESFASIRMNDVHDSFLDGMTSWKFTHPQFMVDTCGMLPEFELYTTAQDFSHPQVRERKLEIIDEISQRYDVDGFELDYIRHPVLFSRRMRGEPCNADEVQTITSFMHQIRRITDAAAARRRRPLLIAVRLPDTSTACLVNGMNLAAWLEEDLIDILIAGGGYAPFGMPLDSFVEACRPHGVPIFPCVNQGTADLLSQGEFLAFVRALATNWYQAGADGLYFWNLGSPFEFKEGEELEQMRRNQYACTQEVGDPAMLAGKEKLYCVDSGTSALFPQYRHVCNPPPLPLETKHGLLRSGVIGRVPLNVGEDLASQAGARATLVVDIDEPFWGEVLVVRLNGAPLTMRESTPAGDGQKGSRLEFPVQAPLLRTGLNFVEFAAQNGVELPETVATIEGVRLKVEQG